MKILLVGGAGYLGGALTDLDGKFRFNNDYEPGHANEIIVYDNLTFEEGYRKNIHFIRGDIRERHKLKSLLEWADCVVWLAAIVGDGACEINPGLTIELNQHSVKWLAANFDGRIIFMSTCSVYGAHDGELDENSPTNPLSLYAQTKLKAESYLKDKNAIIFRLGTLFGLGDEYSRIRLDLVVNTMTARAVQEGKLKVFGGEQWRPLLHVRDAAQAIADNINSKHTGIYNLHNENMKILDLGNMVEKYVPNIDIEIEDIKFEDSRNYKVNSDKARAIGFSPKYSVASGITEVAELLREGRIKDPNNPRYSNVGFLTKENI